MRAARRFVVAALVLASAGTAHAGNALVPGVPLLDPPTLVGLGVWMPITGDDNFNATVTMRYRVAGSTAWRDALPLQHVHAEVVTGLTVVPQFAGSLFDLAPDTSYEIELHAVDPDGGDVTQMLTGRTRPVPAKDPATPRMVPVTSAAMLSSALNAAQPGDVIQLAAGTYSGAFAINASGTAAQPIVIRGASEDGVILDGQGCAACNVLEVYGSFVHIEELTLQHASRALRFQTTGATDEVVRHVHIRDVILGIGSKPDQKDFYLADNILEGRLVWPCVYTSDDPACNAGAQHGLHANDDGIHVEGTGHVIAHNRLSGFGDAMKTEQDGAVSIDFYGNDVLSAYDNGLELDGSARNTRALRNRFTNTFATLSLQPIFGGPAYVVRNVLVNVADEQFKLHARGADPTVGAVLYHNTVVRGTRALQCSTSDAPMHFTVENNLFVGPTVLDAGNHTVAWDVSGIATATLDFNGFYPDGMFEYAYGSAGTTYPSFAAVVAAAHFDAHSTLLDAAALTGGTVGTPDWHLTQTPMTPTLAASSGAIDRGTPLPNIDDEAQGAPDLGAIEAGCAPPIYGPRPAGTDETNEVFGCTPDTGGDDAGVGGDDPAGGNGGKDSGCGCHSTSPAMGAGWLAMLVVLARRRRRR